MPIKNAIHSQQVYDPTDDSIMAEQELCMERLLEQLPNGYSDHYVPNGFEMDDVQKFERAENFLHVYSSKETEESYTVRCSIIQPGQQSLFDNEHTVYETVKVGEADGVLGTSTDEHGKNVYTLSWEHRGITHTVMGNIPYDEIMKIAEGIR